MPSRATRQPPQGVVILTPKIVRRKDLLFRGTRAGGRNSMVTVQDVHGGASFKVKVHPRAHKDGITGEVGDSIKLALTAPPVDGKANESCLRFFAELLEVPRSSVTIAAGQNSRNKIIRVIGRTAAEVRTRLLK